ncbi:MAG: inorganic phosphate transporter, partial [bacterium]|nr:inorganic phosphate transporter [bacterium]
EWLNHAGFSPVDVKHGLGTMAGTAVAATIGKGIVRAEVIDPITIAAAMLAIVVWSTLAWWHGLPTSESHALVAALSGAGLATAGPGVLLWDGWRKVIIGLGFSSVLGFSGGFLLLLAVTWWFRKTPLGLARRLFGRLQIFSAAFMAFSHGSNDGQKFIGVFTLTLVLGGVLPEFQIHFWVILLCAVTMGIGTALGGWRIVHTMGMRLTKLEPYQGFAAETAAASAIELASRLGIPVSTTHTINTAIMGVGATRRLSAVRWGVGLEIVAAWVLTFPACALFAWAAATLLRRVF